MDNTVIFIFTVIKSSYFKTWSTIIAVIILINICDLSNGNEITI